MKKRRFLIPLFMFSMLISLGGCNNDNENIDGGNSGDDNFFDKEEYTDRLLNIRTVNAEGGKFYWTLEASDDWELIEDCDWLAVEPNEGFAGQTGLIFKIDKISGTYSEEVRSTNVTVIVGNTPLTYVISQYTTGMEEEKTYCRFVDSKIFNIEGGRLERILEVSGDWTVNIPEGSWLTMKPTTGKAGQTPVMLTATPIENGLLRSELLTFTVDGETIYVTVSQNLNENTSTMNLL